MFKLTTGNIIDQQAEVLVNTVNCVGIMGKGIALQFKKAFPKNFNAYKSACDRNEVAPGHIFVFETGELYPRYIFNFPTKRHWRGKSKLEDIQSGMESLVTEINRLDIHSIAIPPLGSGLGGLDWDHVLPTIKKNLAELHDVDVTIFEPTETPDPMVMSRTLEIPKMNESRAAMIVLMNKYLQGFLDPFISLLEVQKLMYFLQISGEPLKLRFEKDYYGPYAQNLSPVLRLLEGHYIDGYGDGGNNPTKSLSLIAGALDDANLVLKEHPNTLNNINKVSALVEGFETFDGLELLASAHWLINEHSPSSSDELADLFYEWNDNKKRFSKRQIEKATSRLQNTGWIQPLTNNEDNNNQSSN